MKTIKLIFSFVLVLSLISIQANAQDKKGRDEVFRIVEDMPEYPGGEDALRDDIAGAIKYPDEAKKKEISGKVYVSFVVDENGKVKDPKIARGVNPLLDKEALRVMGLLKTWKPGKQRGIKVKVEYTVPINFALNGNKKKVSETVSGDDEPVFFIVEDMPEFPGGEDALRKHISESIKYPQTAKEKGIQGKVFISFVVSKDGTITQTKVERGVDSALDKEALRVINELPKWKPGKQRGQSVNVKFTIPVIFALE